MTRVYSLLFSFATAVVALDQWSKAAILDLLNGEGDSMSLLSWFDFTLVFNPAAAFGLFRDLPPTFRTWFFYLLPPVILVLIWFVYVRHFKPKETLGPIALGLVIGGAIGNYIDRLTIERVVDFVDWHYTTSSTQCIPLFYFRAPSTCHWPAFNIADSAICIAIVLLLGSQTHLAWTEYKEKKAA